MSHFLVYFDFDNTFDILHESFVKHRTDEGKCKVSYINKSLKNGLGVYTGYIEYNGQEEKCLLKARELHPHHFRN